MRESFSTVVFVEQLRDLLSSLPPECDPSMISSNRLGKLKGDIEECVQRLGTLVRQIDPIQQPPTVFDPADPRVIGELIGRTLLEQPRLALESVPRFYGSGVYAIYYKGDFSGYSPIAGTDHPIYIGKADPAVPEAQTVEQQGDRLARRLSEHAKSVKNVKNLDIADFECRYLVVKSAWQRTSEDYLINRFKPIWNNEIGICYGFGKHGDSFSTRKNTRSPWDTLHPGRQWAWAAGNVNNPKSPKEILREIALHFEKNPPLA